MSHDAPFESPHGHAFLGQDHRRNERRTWAVILVTAVMMVAEIAVGTMSGSMALVADGWHMATHAGAMLIAALAYAFARRQAGNPRFSFGTGKIGDLAAFASACLLALIALLIGWESLVRLYSPVAIDFGQAVTVACLGLAVNLLCAWLLHDGHAHGHHHHGHGHDHAQHAAGHQHHHHHHHHHDAPQARDNNLRAAYLHVLADALTSVLAIAALLLGRFYGWAWMDPAIGLVGGLVIARWSVGLIRDAGRVLVDYLPAEAALPAAIRQAIETEADWITDLHVWQLGPGHHAAILSIASRAPQSLAAYRARLRHLPGLSHLTIEILPIG